MQKTHRTRCRQRAAFTVLELLVSIGVVTIVLSLLLPAVMRARESARRITCTSHLRELGVAMHNFHDLHGRLPPAWETRDSGDSFALGWASHLLAQLEQSAVRAEIHQMRSPVARLTREYADMLSLPVMICPSDIMEPSFELRTQSAGVGVVAAFRSNVRHPADSTNVIWLPTSSYAGVYGTREADDFAEQPPAQQLTFADGSIVNSHNIAFHDLNRGLSNTYLVGERKMATVPTSWLGVDLRGEDAPCRLVGSAITSPNCDACDECEFSSRHPGGSNFLWADGHVSLVSDSIDSTVYQQCARRQE